MHAVDIFLKTSFPSGKNNGKDVPSFLDIEISTMIESLHNDCSSLPCPSCNSTDIALSLIKN